VPSISCFITCNQVRNYGQLVGGCKLEAKRTLVSVLLNTFSLNPQHNGHAKMFFGWSVILTNEPVELRVWNLIRAWIKNMPTNHIWNTVCNQQLQFKVLRKMGKLNVVLPSQFGDSHEWLWLHTLNLMMWGITKTNSDFVWRVFLKTQRRMNWHEPLFISSSSHRKLISWLHRLRVKHV
jgi:hypothetical protein